MNRLFLHKPSIYQVYLYPSNPKSIVGKLVDINIDINMHKSQESWPLHCTPTHSNVLMMFLINTLAMSMCELKDIKQSDFSKNHPGGQIGRDMCLTVESIIRPKQNLPTATVQTTLIDALTVMSSGCCGSIVLVNDHNALLGIFTDGDLRRALEDTAKPSTSITIVCQLKLLFLHTIDTGER